MTRYARAIFASLAVVTAGVWGRDAAAQVPGLPVYNGGFSTGFTLAGTVGFTGGDSQTGDGKAYGVSGTLGVGVFALTAIVSRFDPSGTADGATSVGGNASLKIFGGPLIPLAVYVQGGVSRHTEDAGTVSATVTNVPVGLGLALTIPSPVFAIKPWVAPRLQFTRLSTGTTSDTDTDFGLSAGVDLTMLNGLGFRAGYDMVNGDDPTVSVGLSYSIRIRGL